MAKKNEAAQALAARRMKKMTAERRREVARMGAMALNASKSKRQRRIQAMKAARASALARAKRAKAK